MLTTATIFNYFTRLVAAHYLPDKSDYGLEKGLALKSKAQLKETKYGLANYSARQAVNAIHYIREFDTKSKGIQSMQNEFKLLKELIFKIFT